MIGEGRDKSKFDGRIYYARLHLWTDLEEADPRNIPGRLYKTPNSSITTKSRSLPDDEYQQWLKGPEAQELLTKKNDRFKRETIMEQSRTHQQAESFQTAGSFLGSFIDGLINRVTDQIVRQLSEHQVNPSLPQISEIEKRLITLESAINRLVTQPQADRASSPHARPSRSSDIGQLSSLLRNLLGVYIHGSSDDRDNLMKANGKELMDLDHLVHALTRRPRDREEILRLNEEAQI